MAEKIKLSANNLSELSRKIEEATRDTIISHFSFEDAPVVGKSTRFDMSNLNATLTYHQVGGFELYIENKDKTNLSPDALRSLPPKSPLRNLSDGSVRLAEDQVLQALEDLRDLDIPMERGAARTGK